MRDLEIRGAGNLLGAEQSGHMEAVDYDMYCKMLNEAVLAMKGVTRKEDAFDTAIDLQLDAYIPEDYIPDETEKLSWYKRVALGKSQEDYEDMTEELTDRYGDVPAPLLRLLQVALLREEAHRSWLLSVEQKGDDLLFTMNNMAEVQVEKIDAFLKQYHNHMKVKVEKNPVFVYHDEKLLKKDIIDKVKEIVLKIRTLLETKPE
jgi:transcription-repair coupling factor (superfamily II helicase)